MDVVTWSLTVLPVEMIDRDFDKFGAAYRAWTNIRTLAGYFVGDELLGVGYSDLDHNGKGNKTADGIVSAEWTFGAISCVRSLHAQYSAMLTTTKNSDEQE